MKAVTDILGQDRRAVIGGAPEGFDAAVLAALAEQAGQVLCVARDDVSLARKLEALRFMAPAVCVLDIPAWDCLPYDRVSPNPEVVNRRMCSLCALVREPIPSAPRVILTTVSAFLQRVPPRAALDGRALHVAPGDELSPETLYAFLERNGYLHSDTVMEAGEYATRGGIVDVFPAGAEAPSRLDFFGDEVETIRRFDPVTQRTVGEADGLDLIPVSEVFLDEDAISRFRTGYRETFGVTGDDDPLYEAVSAGRRHIGMEHWLPLFHDTLETLADYVPDAPLVLDHQAEEARDGRLELIDEYCQARKDVPAGGLSSGAAPYLPVPPERLFLDAGGWDALVAARKGGTLSPFGTPEGEAGYYRVDAGGRPGRDFADARVQPDVNLFDAVLGHVRALEGEGKRVAVTAQTEGSLERLRKVLGEHGLDAGRTVQSWADVLALGAGTVGLAVAGFERGFVTADAALLSETDFLGERLTRPSRAKVKPENIIQEASSLNAGDLVVHVDHGIGRFDGLHTIEAAGAPHDCLRILYEGSDKLFLPVENIELISRYGSEEAGAQLDRLGGAAWQARKARLKERIREMAGELIKIAAARELRPGAKLAAMPGAYDEFCARFPYAETDDQQRAIDAALEDLSTGRNADRLVCGDVGFGKTEVALRAAFVTAMAGKQVAVVVPTTLLCRQHFETFVERFRDFPVRIEQLSRLVASARAKDIKSGLADGTVDIVVGTHALLARDVAFRDLGLLVVDEEQHFGVAHKERLKKLKADVHVLTLTATPIPRTLQMALTGVRDMSLIATPPVDRLAVRTFVLPYDPVVIREAILRERFRGGQTFYVCPRIADLDKVATELEKLVPEASVVVAHGKMAPKELERAVTEFYDGKHDILLSTNIIESGLDMPRVNTIVIHRADKFGLAQLYQLRGRVGRAKTRAYAYITLPPGRKLTPAAERRLEVMQTLDHLGAGFSLASHDLDIRGAGNLLGEEQSGHIREVGIELYQQMLEEAVAEARGLEGAAGAEEWSPQINLGIPVLIPEAYVPDLTVRMGLYRRIAHLSTRAEVDALAAEMIDRFGPLPEEAENLLEAVTIKQLCREAGVEKVDAGPKGAVVAFRGNDFANPAGLVGFIQENRGTAKLRPSHELVYSRAWDDEDERVAGVRVLLKTLAGIAASAPAA